MAREEKKGWKCNSGSKALLKIQENVLEDMLDKRAISYFNTVREIHLSIFDILVTQILAVGRH